jgi:hypothetical protein
MALHCISLLIGGWESEVGFVFCFVGFIGILNKG